MVRTTIVLMVVIGAASIAEAQSDGAATAPRLVFSTAGRPIVLAALYDGFAGLQGFDGVMTISGVHKGSREANPFMRRLAEHPTLFWTVKAAATAAPIVLAEHLWKTHRKRSAIALMTAVDGAMVVIAVNNTRALRRQMGF